MMTMMMILRRLARQLTPAGWATILVLLAFLLFGAWCSHRGANAVRADQARAELKTERRASAGRETAAIQRADDKQAITTRQQERDHAAHALPDSPPDDRERLRRCRQLRDAGREPELCARLRP